ncbi:MULTISPECIES: lycopene cyclase domain-containing protein [unclassified Cellulomonas]|uniref:lycopene cyclase domain-containing protein n=1 Tax=unclassified Cellulomonas TaxID=2620175 RepID=UPI0019C538C5|nr:lycopene cyclase domain-containing protein [Cellulomonas sp. ES6]MBD3778685.1 lycopene cyclase domain-containing protein [Micrococcales bacterium]WHP16822.1 lycopene cyclase domain-containing protein [Cellulomonas sp. ES6]
MTNIVLNVLVLLALVVASWRVLRRVRPGPLVWTALHLCLLTMVFDTVMIAADLYVFDEDKILGVYLWGAPLEDFAYAIAAALAMPVLWTVLAGREARRSAAGAGPAATPGEGV